MSAGPRRRMTGAMPWPLGASSAGTGLRGIGLMALATLMYAANDTLVKLATQDLSPIDAMFYRGVAATLWSVPLLLATRQAPSPRLMRNPWVLLRSTLHLGSVFCFMSADMKQKTEPKCNVLRSSTHGFLISRGLGACRVASSSGTLHSVAATPR